MSEPEESKKDLDILTEEVKAEPESESDGEVEIKPKKVLTEKQKEVLRLAREKRTQNIRMKNEEKTKQKEEEEKKKNELIVKKAVAIKKKEMKQKAIIQLTPEEEEAYEEPIKAPVKKVNAPPRNPPLSVGHSAIDRRSNEPPPPPTRPKFVFI